MKDIYPQEVFLDKWKKIVTHGGVFDDMIKENLYLSGAIYIYVNCEWIYICIRELGEDNFFLSIGREERPPIPETAKINTIPRKSMEKFPEDCRLDYLRDYGATSAIFTPIEITKNNFLCQNGLIVESGNGYKFKIEPSEEVWGFLEISMIS